MEEVDVVSRSRRSTQRGNSGNRDSNSGSGGLEIMDIRRQPYDLQRRHEKRQIGASSTQRPTGAYVSSLRKGGDVVFFCGNGRGTTKGTAVGDNGTDDSPNRSILRVHKMVGRKGMRRINGHGRTKVAITVQKACCDEMQALVRTRKKKENGGLAEVSRRLANLLTKNNLEFKNGNERKASNRKANQEPWKIIRAFIRYGRRSRPTQRRLARRPPH